MLFGWSFCNQCRYNERMLMFISETNRTVTALKRNCLGILAVATITLAAGTPVLAQTDSTRAASDISLVVDGSGQIAVMPLIAETDQSPLLTYDFPTGEVQFSAGVLAPDYNDPLFCFDMGGAQTAVSLRVTDPNGHVVIDQYDLNTSLDYVLAAPSSVVVQPSLSQQCFFRSSQGVFGLFGMENVDEPVSSDVISRDRFEPNRSISLEFQGVKQFVTPGETVTYDLVLTNTGTAELQDVALQEVFPENLGVYAATLSAGTWSCSPTGDAVCPGSSANPNSLRFEQMNSGGADLTVGDSLTFTIERTVDINSLTDVLISLHAGAVADPIATGTPFAVDEATMTVIGESAGLSVASATTTADSAATTGDASDDAQITVTVVDGNQNPVPNESVSVDNTGGLTLTSATSGTSDANGEVSFTATAQSAGNYTISFTSGTLVGSGNVTIGPGAPAAMVAAALDAEAQADGIDSPLVRVLVEDQFGNRVDAAEVTADTIPDPGALPSLQNSVFTSVDGEADFTPTSTVADIFQLGFAVNGAGTDSATVEFLPGAPDALFFTQGPTTVAAEATMSPAVALRVVDSENNWVNDDQSTFVQLRLRQNGVTVDSDIASGTVSNGEIQFSNLIFDSSLVGTGYSLRAVGTTNSDIFFVDSATFDITTAQ